MRRPPPGMPARRAALRVLSAVRDGRPFDAALDAAVPRLADADRRLVHELSAGVLRQRTVLDHALAPLVSREWTSVTPALQDILRLGAYQLHHLDRIPDHAAVTTSAELAREHVGRSAVGFVNAVLRKVAAEPSLFAPTAEHDADLPVETAGRASHPEWLVSRWLRQFGSAATGRLMEWNNRIPSLVLQPARSDIDALTERWQAAGIAVRPVPFGAGLVTDRTRPEELPGFAEGAFYVQDPAQVLVTWFAEFEEPGCVLDLCAAPGGKTLALGRGGAPVAALELHPRRAARLVANLLRAGGTRTWPVIGDAAAAPFRPAPAVLLDAPCLGTGTFARHPDARWRVTPEALETLVAAQARLLDASAGVVAPGGLLVYATCSLEPEENESQVQAFLERHPEFRREPPALFPASLLTAEGDLAVLPQKHGTDGAYAARLRRAE